MDDRVALTEKIKSRIVALGALFATGFLGLIVILFLLQIVNAPHYAKKAIQLTEQSSYIAPPRGKIYDCFGDVPLASNVDSFVVEVVPAEVREWETFPVSLGNILEMSPAVISKMFPETLRDKYRAVEVKTGIPFLKVVEIAENVEKIPGVRWFSQPTRHQNYPGSISHVLGHVGKITTEELQILYNRGYNYRSHIGKSGIERRYDNLLRGTEGKRREVVNVKGQTVRDADHVTAPSGGKDVILTIDRHIQTLAEKLLAERPGSVVVLKPTTGEILAMVSNPWVDLNRLTNLDSETFENLAGGGQSLFFNRAVQAAYPLGSIFKLVLDIAVREEELFSPHRRIHCPGFIRVGDTIFHCSHKEGHGFLNLREAFGVSCNIFFITAGLELGMDRITHYAHLLGLGESVGIDLEGEARGFIPTPEWKKRSRGESWTPGDTANASIGQGFIEVTPLQVANMVAAIVNKGQIYKPHILKAVRNPGNSEIEKTVEPELLAQVPVRPEVFEEVQKDMLRVTQQGASRWTVLNQAATVAGKTGTAERGKTGDLYAWFASFGPFEQDPEDQIVVVVTVDQHIDEWFGFSTIIADLLYQGIFAHQNYEEVIQNAKRRGVWYLKHLLSPQEEKEKKV